MNKRYVFNFNLWVYVLYAVITAGVVPLIVVLTLSVADVGNFSSFNVGIDIAAIAVMTLVLISATVTLFHSGYRMGKDKLMSSISFFTRQIKYNDMLLVRIDKENAIMLLYYKLYAKNGEVLFTYITVNIKFKYFDDFTDDLRKNAKGLKIELYEKNFDGGADL